MPQSRVGVRTRIGPPLTSQQALCGGAREASQVEVFAAVADAVSGLLGEEVRMVRYEADDAVVVAGSVGPLEHVFPVGSRVLLGGNNAVSRVFRTGKPVRIDDYREATGPIADTVRL